MADVPLIRRMRGELIVGLTCIVILAISIGVQRSILRQPSIEPGATVTNYSGLLGAPLDDVYIHCRFAENVLHGFGYGFNPNEPVTADTSPLWVGLLVVSGIFTTSLPTAAILLSALCYVLLSIGVYRASRELYGLSERWALLAGLLIALSSRLVWSGLSGMETSLAALLMFLTVEEHERNRQRSRLRWREGLWLGLGIATRPEFFFVASVTALDWMILSRKITLTRTSILKALATLILLAAPTLILPLAIEGRIVSHSSIVQGARLQSPNFGYLWFAAKVLASNNVVLAFAVAAAFLALCRDRSTRILIIIGIGLPVLQSFIAPQFRHHGRYFFPVIPLIVIAATKVIHDVLQRRNTRWSLAIAAAALLAGTIEMARWVVLESEAVRNINDQHLAAAQYLKTALLPSDHLAVDDVGAVGYYTDRSVLDLTGLVSPAFFALQSDQHKVWEQARLQGANAFLIYNRLNPSFYESARDSLVLVREFRIRKPLVSSADTVMSFYRLRDAH